MPGEANQLCRKKQSAIARLITKEAILPNIFEYTTLSILVSTYQPPITMTSGQRQKANNSETNEGCNLKKLIGQRIKQLAEIAHRVQPASQISIQQIGQLRQDKD